MNVIRYGLIIGLYLGVVPTSSNAGTFSGSDDKTSSIYQLSDPNSRLSFQHVRQLPLSQWQPVPAVNFGTSGGAGWAYSVIYSKQSQKIWLELPTHFVDSIKVWLVSGSEQITEYPVTGFWHLANAGYSPLRHRYFLFELPLEANQTYQIYIRGYVVPGMILKFAVKYWQPTHFLDYYRNSDGGWIAFASIILTAVGIALLSFFFYPRLIYLYYAGYITFLALYAMSNDGWGIFFPILFYKQLNPVTIGYFLVLSLTCFLLFSRQFLSIPFSTGPLWLRLNPVWLGLLTATCIGTSHYGYAFQKESLIQAGYFAGVFLELVAGALWLSYLVSALRRGFRPAWLLLSSQVVMLLFYATNIFVVNTGLLQRAFPDMLVFRAAVITELFIIGIGWLYRQKVVREAHLQLQAEKIRQREALGEALRQKQGEEIKALRLEKELSGQRERLARDLHDGIGSHLTYIITRLDLMSERPTDAGQLKDLSDFTRETNRYLRETIWVLNQEQITLCAWGGRLRGWLARLGEGMETPLLHTESPDSKTLLLTPSTASALFHIGQEAVNNALKYAQAQHITLRLTIEETTLHFSVEDDGKGFDITTVCPGYGLSNMQRRTEELAGIFSLYSSKKGTLISIKLPFLGKNS